MKKIKNNPFTYGRAICYSGFRKGQMPGGRYPSYEEVKEDLNILERTTVGEKVQPPGLEINDSHLKWTARAGEVGNSRFWSYKSPNA